MSEFIGVIGLGIMGTGMARNLHAKGHKIAVWNRTHAKAEALARELQVEAPASVAELAATASVVLMCVKDTPDVEQVIFGGGGVVETLAAGSLVIDTSTISPKATEGFAARLAERGIGFVDAPVSGGSEGAAKGTLAIMVGGSDADFARALPVLEAIGQRITHMGPAGRGQVTKLLNQILVVVNMMAVSEALLFGKAAGLDLPKAVKAVESGAAASWMLSARAPQVLNDYWEPGFMIDLQQKDLKLVLEYAEELGVPLLVTGMISQLYARLQKEGKGRLGNHALIQALEPLVARKT